MQRHGWSGQAGMVVVTVAMLAVSAAGQDDPPATRPAMQPATQPAALEENPPAPGFDLAGSDPKAIALADAVMKAMGGRAAWDRTRYLTWRFFGGRRHVWDRHTGDVRIEGSRGQEQEPYVILMNVGTGEGRAWQAGTEIEDPEALREMLDNGRRAWINDSYWLVMPYKLKDTGVTLTHGGEQLMEDGRPADVLQLTFAEVGETPQNRYEVFVARASGLVEQWNFYRDAADAEPRFKLPWTGWTRHGEIMLSAHRGQASLTEIAVVDDVPRKVFESPEPWEREAVTADQ